MTSDKEQDLFSNLEFSYSRSKDDVWNALDKVTSGEPAQVEEVAKQGKVVSINWRVLSVAASVVLILSAGLFARFYTTTVEVGPGEFTNHTLPDGSEIHLNAATAISYSPYWWKMDRSVELSGEAYFVVAKGKKFSVHTELGTTEVLGTEFNVYARGDDFHVFCETGRVKVTSDVLVDNSPEEVVLTRGELAIVELNSSSKTRTLVKQTEEVEDNVILSWRTGQFIYNTTPLSKVFEDMERHYGVSIRLIGTEADDQGYTASLKRDLTLEEVLQTICLTKGLTSEKQGDNSYLIQPKRPD